MSILSRDNYALSCYPAEEEADYISVIRPYCYHETPFNIYSFTNRCKHCSIIINQEVLNV